MFFYCSELESLVVPEGVTEIGESAFKNCKKLGNITVPGTVSRINARAFAGCHEDLSISFGGTKAEWGAISKKDMFGSWLRTKKTLVYCTDGMVTE